MLTIDLTGKIALVVGGSRGIGAGVVATLARAGAHVTFTHTGRHSDRVQALLAEAGGSVETVVADAVSEPETNACVDDIIAKHGKIDILVHNAGKNNARRVEEMTLESWHEYIDLNLTSAYISVRAVIPHMVAAGYGRIILMGSSAFYNGGGGAIDYAAGKAGLAGMTVYLAREYARHGIVTNVIHPSAIATDLLNERYGTPDKRAEMIAQVPVGRLGTPEDVAGLVAFLASPLGDFICGQNILIDGGRVLFR
jgi:3-oxoacyl-[acyl-carrier protein] reductase